MHIVHLQRLILLEFFVDRIRDPGNKINPSIVSSCYGVGNYAMWCGFLLYFRVLTSRYGFSAVITLVGMCSLSNLIN